MKPLPAAAIWAAWAVPAFGQCIEANCSEAFWRPPVALQRCLVEKEALTDLSRQYIEEIADLRRRVDQLVEPNKVMPPCKMKGRTRNAAGQCGRWKK